MRRLAFTAFIALSLVLISSAPALAGSSSNWTGKGSGESVTVWCTPDKGTGIDINGTFTVPNGHHGPEVLLLEGSKGAAWSFGGQWRVLNTVNGQTTYSFSFDVMLDLAHFTSYRVADDDVWSRTINRDECGFRVPEAPSSGLLLLGALPVAGLVGMKVAGVRLPRPHWTRVA